MRKINKFYFLLIIPIIAIIAFVVIRILPNPNEDETETLYCGENNSKPVKVFKNPTKAFPNFAEEFNNKITFLESITDSLTNTGKFKLSLDLNSKVIELKEKLNQESIRMEMIMKSNFLAFNNSPCDTVVSKKYYELLNIMAQKNNELENLRMKLTIPSTKGGNEVDNLMVVKDTSLINTSISTFKDNYKFER